MDLKLQFFVCENATSSPFDYFIKQTLLTLAEKTPESESLLNRLKFLIASKFLDDFIY